MPDDLRPRLADLTTGQRAELAAAWWADGQNAAGSARTYAQLRQRLSAIGAPAALLRAVSCAHRDELRHATTCRDLAAAYSPSVVAGATSVDSRDLEEPPTEPPFERRRMGVPVRILFDGCVGEPLRASVAQVAAERCTDSAVRSVLRRAAAQASRHAGLCWRAMRWLLRCNNKALPRQALARAVARLLAQFQPRPVGMSTTWTTAHGRLSEEHQRAIVASCLHEVVAPCLQALLADTRSKQTDRSADATPPPEQRSPATP